MRMERKNSLRDSAVGSPDHYNLKNSKHSGCWSPFMNWLSWNMAEGLLFFFAPCFITFLTWRNQIYLRTTLPYDKRAFFLKGGHYPAARVTKRVQIIAQRLNFGIALYSFLPEQRNFESLPYELCENGNSGYTRHGWMPTAMRPGNLKTRYQSFQSLRSTKMARWRSWKCWKWYFHFDSKSSCFKERQ